MLNRSIPPQIQPTSFAFRKPVEHVMCNGMPLYIIEATGMGAIRIDFVFSVGQYHQVRKLQALFTCRMLREGCRGYTAAEFAEQLDYYGAWLELSVAMNRTFVTLYTLKKHFSATLELVHRMLTEPTYDENQFAIVCANNKAQLLVNLQKGSTIAMRALRSSVYGDQHPCGMQPYPKDYDTLRVGDLTDYYHHFYGSHTCCIYLSGDVGESELSHIEELFGHDTWGTPEIDCRKTNVWENLSNSNPLPPSSLNLQLKDAVQESIRLGNLLMDINDPDYLSTRVLTTILGGYFGSRLMKNIREEKGYTYHIGADLITNTSQVMFLIHCEAQTGRSQEIIEEIHREMSRLHTELISDEELQLVRNYMIGEICRNYENAFSLTDAYIFMHHLELPLTHLEQTVEAIRSTDAIHLQQLAQRYFRPENLHSVVVHP